MFAFVAFAAQGTSPVAAAPALDIEKNAQGLHQGGEDDGAREYRIRARNTEDALVAGQTITIVDDIDNSLVVRGIHDVHEDWTCNLAQPGNILTCTLDAGAQLSDQFEDIVFFDACDTLVRGSVSNDATIRLNTVVQATDTANPDVPECAAVGPKLTLEKECAGSYTGTFTINVTGPNFNQSRELACGASTTLTVVGDVEYTVSENETGYEASIRGACDGDGTVTLSDEDDFEGTCVIRNEAVSNAADLTVVKECADSYYGHFTIKVTGPEYHKYLELKCGEQETLSVHAGVEYTVSEHEEKYDASIRGACDGDGTVTLAEPGDKGTCVVRNEAHDKCDYGYNKCDDDCHDKSASWYDKCQDDCGGWYDKCHDDCDKSYSRNDDNCDDDVDHCDEDKYDKYRAHSRWGHDDCDRHDDKDKDKDKEDDKDKHDTDKDKVKDDDCDCDDHEQHVVVVSQPVPQSSLSSPQNVAQGGNVIQQPASVQRQQNVATTAQDIRPPRTGEAGLLAESRSQSHFGALAIAGSFLVVATLYASRRLGRKS
jgi:hypothetical protein